MAWYEHVLGILAVGACLALIPMFVVAVCAFVLSGRREKKRQVAQRKKELRAEFSPDCKHYGLITLTFGGKVIYSLTYDAAVQLFNDLDDALVELKYGVDRQLAPDGGEEAF